MLCCAIAALGALTRYSFLQGFDLRFTHALQRTSDPILNAVMMGATFMGASPTVVTLAVLIAGWLYLRGLHRGSVVVLASLLSLPLVEILKAIWERSRPDAELVHVMVRRVGYSFPSGHSTISTAFYGCLAALAWIHLADRPQRPYVTAALIAIPPLVWTSRVYLGAHWLSDVVGGGAVGLALLIPLFKWYAPRAIADAKKAEQKVAAA